MAPPPTDPIEAVDESLHDLIHTLYILTLQTYSHTPTTRPALASEVRSLISALTALSSSARAAGPALPSVPAEIVEYVEAGRNPDVYTREFVELAQRRNQEIKGKAGAFGVFREALAREVVGGLGGEVEKEVGKVGGKVEGGEGGGK